MSARKSGTIVTSSSTKKRGQTHSKKDQRSTPGSKQPLVLDSPILADRVGQEILKFASLFDPLTSNYQWLFDNALLLDLKKFLSHVSGLTWKTTYGFVARPCQGTDLWEILCPSIVHKTRVTTEFLTDFAANLPEGTKIDIGGFKNV